MLRCLIAIEDAVRILLLWFLPQHHCGSRLRGSPERGVVVVLFGRGGDAVAGKHQRQIEGSRSAGRQRREGFAEFQRNNDGAAIGAWRSDQLGPVWLTLWQRGLKSHDE